jgi:hypothetical protein
MPIAYVPSRKANISEKYFLQGTRVIIKEHAPAEYHDSNEFEYDFHVTDKSAPIILNVWPKGDKHRARPPFQHTLEGRLHEMMRFTIDMVIEHRPRT